MSNTVSFDRLSDLLTRHFTRHPGVKHSVDGRVVSFNNIKNFREVLLTFKDTGELTLPTSVVVKLQVAKVQNEDVSVLLEEEIIFDAEEESTETFLSKVDGLLTNGFVPYDFSTVLTSVSSENLDSTMFSTDVIRSLRVTGITGLAQSGKLTSAGIPGVDPWFTVAITSALNQNWVVLYNGRRWQLVDVRYKDRLVCFSLPFFLNTHDKYLLDEAVRVFAEKVGTQ